MTNQQGALVDNTLLVKLPLFSQPPRIRNVFFWVCCVLQQGNGAHQQVLPLVDGQAWWQVAWFGFQIGSAISRSPLNLVRAALFLVSTAVTTAIIGWEPLVYNR